MKIVIEIDDIYLGAVDSAVERKNAARGTEVAPMSRDEFVQYVMDCACKSWANDFPTPKDESAK